MGWLSHAWNAVKRGDFSAALGETMYAAAHGASTLVYGEELGEQALNSAILEPGGYIDRQADRGEMVIDAKEALANGEIIEGTTGLVKGNLGALTDGLATSASPEVLGLTNATREEVAEIAKNVENGVQNVGDGVKFAYDVATKGPQQTLLDRFWESNIGQFLIETWDSIQNFFSNLWDDPMGTLWNAASGLIEWVQEAFSVVSGAVNDYVIEPVAERTTNLYNNITTPSAPAVGLGSP